MKRVGIPQGLFYVYYYPLWKTFFEDLGAEVVHSGNTSHKTMEKGINAAVDETCFPVKVYFGHVCELCECGLDYLFIPRIVSVEEKSYICPKFMGIPDMIRASIPNLPPLLSPLVDLSKGDKEFKRDIVKVGKEFTRNEKKIKEAYLHGLEELHTCMNLTKDGYTTTEAIEVWEGGNVSLTKEHDLNVGVLGHGYSLYDQAISLNLIIRLRDLGCRVHTVEMMNPQAVEQQAATMPKRVFWTLGRKTIGSALHMKEDDGIDGIIYLACFGCGPDSFVGEIVERKLGDKPWMMLTIDEHTGEAGMLTRLEAFCDMLRRRRKMEVESHLPAHGQPEYCPAGSVGGLESKSYSAAAYQ